MKMYCILPDLSFETDHYVIDDPAKPAHKEVIDPGRILIIEKDIKGSGGFYLQRYAWNGRYIGDTWHQNLQDAKHQAIFEYGEPLTEWNVLSEDDEDIELVVSHLVLQNYDKDYVELNSILNEYDFLYVIPVGVRNEYEDLIKPILTELSSKPTNEELADMLTKFISDSYGLPSFTFNLEYAERIINWWNARKIVGTK